MALFSTQDPSPECGGPRIGLAMAGGGPEGAIYEIGALRALDDAFDGLDFNDVPVTVGVSAGAFVGACLANGITTAQLVRSVVHEEPGEHPFRPELFLSPAFDEYLRRGVRIPFLLMNALTDFVRHPKESSGLVSSLLGRLGQALPVGLFNNAPLREFLEATFTKPGRTDSFAELPNKLYVVASDLDAGTPVVFGEDDWQDVPISRAVQASTALPGLYPPVEVRGRHYVDGVLLKTVHASIALDAGADLVLCVNPIVPVDTAEAVERGVMRRGRLLDRGLVTVLNQTFRTLIRSRMGAGIAAYAERYAGRDVMLIEPRRDDYTMFFRNIFSFTDRKEVVEHAYQSTLKQLHARHDELAPILAKHGITLRRDVTSVPVPDLWRSVGVAPERLGGEAVLPTTVATRDLTDALTSLRERIEDLEASIASGAIEEAA